MEKGTIRNYDSPLRKSLRYMSLNDVFHYPSLGDVVFQEWKRGGKSFRATQLSTNKQFNCRCSIATAVAEYSVIGMYIPPIIPNDIDKLQPGELFAIQVRKDAVLLKVLDITPSGKIRACNPLEPSLIFNIDRSFTFTLLKNIK